MSQKPVFEKVLVANRGEIALRIMRTLREINIQSVAVYSEADINSLHVQFADEAYYIGESSATDSYLSIPHVIDAIRKSGADAVHPGYGFLSENTDFAKAVEREGCTFIGPSPEAIRQMGDKIEAKKIAIEAGVSTVPGFMGVINDAPHAIKIAEEIGFPVMIKAAAGGGGRGMRVVHNAKEMQSAYISASREAKMHFSDGRVFIEKFISKPRHIEIQLLADKHGNALCLGERECSIQRHHQKIIEEAPSSFISEKIRQEMYAQVISLANIVGYYSAGTVEFIVDQNCNFYFLEMNTRLQVEHPVTELITGIDLVEQMVKVAANQKLTHKQDDIKLNGWAIECRIYAEDPSRGFLPSIDRVNEYVEPPKHANLRIDSGIDAGTEVSMYYDAMVAKLCTYGENRQAALDYMTRALETYVIKGITHNIGFLQTIIAHPKFQQGDIHTGFIEEEYPGGFGAVNNLTEEMTEIFMASALFIFLAEEERSNNHAADENRVNMLGTRWAVNLDSVQYPVMLKPVQDGYNIRYDMGRIYVRSNWSIGSSLFNATVNGKKIYVHIDHIPTGYKLSYAGTEVEVYVRSTRVSELESIMLNNNEEEQDSNLLAPLTGQIVAIKVKEGEEVTVGQELLILSAMKMENIITAENDGVIGKIHAKIGEQACSGDTLIEFK